MQFRSAGVCSVPIGTEEQGTLSVTRYLDIPGN